MSRNQRNFRRIICILYVETLTGIETRAVA